LHQPLDFLRATCCVQPSASLQPFVEHFRRTYGDELAAVVFYGSKLHDDLATATSFYDFYLVVDDYRRFFARRRDRLLAGFLPPNIYYLDLADAGGAKLACKYCVVSRDDLRAAVGPAAKDFYHLGRFSKRLAVIDWRGGADRDAVLDICLQAMRTLLPHALAGVADEFTLQELILRALALSYEGEVRLEPSAAKAEALYRAADGFYQTVWSSLLQEYRTAHPRLFDADADAAGAPLRLRRSADQREAMIAATRRLIRRSRMRARARWPKNILLVENWVDILLAKVERTYGVRIELTPTERRWILLLGWKHYFRLRREGRIR
jgi:hypothetical protein